MLQYLWFCWFKLLPSLFLWLTQLYPSERDIRVYGRQSDEDYIMTKTRRNPQVQKWIEIKIYIWHQFKPNPRLLPNMNSCVNIDHSDTSDGFMLSWDFHTTAFFCICMADWPIFFIKDDCFPASCYYNIWNRCGQRRVESYKHSHWKPSTTVYKMFYITIRC